MGIDAPGLPVSGREGRRHPRGGAQCLLLGKQEEQKVRGSGESCQPARAVTAAPISATRRKQIHTLCGETSEI